MRIAPCTEADVAELDRAIPSPGVVSTHAVRYARQVAGDGTFLVAWLDGRPVGHGEVLWNGCAAPEVRAACPDCPEVNGLGVWPESLRSRGIGTAIVRAAEDLAVRRGIGRLGLGVGADNPRARALYERLGYRPVADYVGRWSYERPAGTVHEVADPCTFLVRVLDADR